MFNIFETIRENVEIDRSRFKAPNKHCQTSNTMCAKTKDGDKKENNGRNLGHPCTMCTCTSVPECLALLAGHIEGTAHVLHCALFSFSGFVPRPDCLKAEPISASLM